MAKVMLVQIEGDVLDTAQDRANDLLHVDSKFEIYQAVLPDSLAENDSGDC